MSASADPRPTVLYDGNCGLCDRWVRFVLRADRGARLQFAPLAADQLAQADSVALQDAGRIYLRSEAVLRTLALLGFPYRLAGVLRLIPLAWRDAAYDLAARHRHKLFAPPSCELATPAERARLSR